MNKQAGERAAGAAALGAKVALIERRFLGGYCLNFGCVPSKCIIRSSRAAADIRNSLSLGVAGPDPVDVDFPDVIHPYQTQAEAVRRVADAYNRTRLTPRIKKLFAAYLRWRR